MRFKLSSIFVIVVSICSMNGQIVAQSIDARFVAFHRFGGLNPRAPVQQLILQTENEGNFPKGSIMKAVFFPSTGGMGGTVKLLETHHLNHSRLWTLVLRSPAEKEKRFCDFDNYMRTKGENVDSNLKGEPTMNFYSTQFEGWVVFPNLSTMRCVVIESMSENLVLSTYYSVAESALRKAIKEKDISTIKKGLNSQFTGIKIEAVEALSEFKDASCIPQLVETLQMNQGVIDGGSEMQTLQNELNKSIVLALENLTGLEFAVTKRLAKEKLHQYEPFSLEEIEEVEKKIREWWKNNQPKN